MYIFSSRTVVIINYDIYSSRPGTILLHCFQKKFFGVRIDLQVIFVVKKVSNYESFRHFLVTQVTIVNKFFTYSLLLYAKKLYVLCSYKLIKNT